MLRIYLHQLIKKYNINIDIILNQFKKNYNFCNNKKENLIILFIIIDKIIKIQILISIIND